MPDIAETPTVKVAIIGDAPKQALNWQPIIDLLAKSGSETSEYAKAKTAGRAAMVVWAIGLLTLLATTATNVAGANSKIGMYAGVAVTVLGLASQIVNAVLYNGNRRDTKEAAAQALTVANPLPPIQ